MNYGYQLIDGYDTSSLLRNYGTSSAGASSDMLLGALAGFLGAFMIVIVVIAVLQIIGMWKVFTKAGEKGWKSLIPCIIYLGF